MRLFIFVTLLSVFSFAKAQNPEIIEAKGWFESAFATWQTIENAEKYNVYFSGEGIIDQIIDNQLIRQYEGYYRADIPGLKAGEYTIKVVPIVSGIETEGSETSPLSVMPYDRSGFAFSNNRVPGAYKADGTLKDNAVVLYITENTKNTISLDVTGADSNPCIGLQTILEGFKKGKDSRPLAVRMVGQITDFQIMDKGDIVIENKNYASSYITFEGVGNDAVADGWGIRVKNASNIEIRNIGLMNTNSNEGDDIGLQQNNEYIWVHHCDFFYGNPGGDADQAKGDGALDCKKSTYVTFSYNHFWDTGKSNLLGLSEGTTEGLFITYHHNWFDHSDSRHPRVRYYSAHVYNNYYDGNAKYGVGSTLGSSVFVEANYFRNCKYPILTSMQGTDVFDESKNSNDYDDMPTFSDEDGGTIKAFNNYMTGQRRFVKYGESGFPNSTIDFDAYVAESRDETIPETVVSSYGGNTYNNFDTNTTLMYNYTPDSPEDARDNVMQYAGRINGGDFKWNFVNAVDDDLYSVNKELKLALTTYKTTLLNIQGDSIPNGIEPEDSTNTGEFVEITKDVEHNFTQTGLNSSYFNISGNLSDSKGTVIYKGFTLTQCLKIETSTSISFTTLKETTLTLVFNEGFNGDIKINGVSYAVLDGIFSQTIEAGNYDITKDDSANLYFINITSKSSALGYINIPNCLIYPNPAQNTLTISSDIAIEKIEIFNLLGALVKQISNKTKQIDLSTFQTGNYFVKIYTNQGTFIQRIVKL